MKYILLGFFLRLIIAIWNGFFGPSIGADGDALLFHDIAVEVSRFGVFDTKFNIGWIYSYFLGIIYFITTLNSIFLGSILSCLAWLASALILNQSIKLIGVQQKYRNRALILYALIPSSILFTSVTLREVYQLLFVNLLFFSSLKILLESNQKFWFLILLSSFCMGALHFGLVLYGILGALITLYFTSIKGGKIFSMELILFYIPILSIFLYLGINLFDQIVPFDFEDGLAAAVQTYQSGHNETRAMYSYKPEIEGLLGLIIFIPISLFQYLLEPMPWKIATGLDLALFFENIFRLILIIFALKNFFTVKSDLKTVLVYSILMFFALEILWALGTVNWGSAVRHHIPAMGILMIIGICFLDPKLRSHKINKKFYKYKKV